MTIKPIQYKVQLIGPSGVISVHDKRQEFIETGSDIYEIESELERRKMSVDPIKGTLEGRYVGCWICIMKLPDQNNEE
ncbi:MAG: hypothetical protein ABW130_19360 [Candidatus Thiodiazotropha lotti]